MNTSQLTAMIAADSASQAMVRPLRSTAASCRVWPASATNRKAVGTAQRVRWARISQAPMPMRPMTWKASGTSPQIR